MGKAKYALILTFILGSLWANAQNENLLDDFRQHNLIHINSSLSNPSFSFDRNNPRSVALWSRWQWQTIDGDPTTLFFNYTQKVGSQLALGIGFFQNTNNSFQSTGGIANVAFGIPMGEEGTLIFGSNVSVFSEEPTDLASTAENNLIGQFSPGMQFQLNRFNVGLAIENALNFNFTNSERDLNERVLSGIISYGIPVELLGAESIVKPHVYLRAIPEADTQVGFIGHLAHPKFWVQGGYNSFYGVSGGAGATLFEKLSVGALMEFGLDDAIADEDPTIELVLSYHFGKQDYDTVEKVEEEEEDDELLKEQQRLEEEAEERRRLEEEAEEQRRLAEDLRQRQARQDSIAKVREAEVIANRQQTQDSIRQETQKQLAAQREQARRDSINQARQRQLEMEREKARQDSLARVAREKEVEVKPEERYEEVVSVDGLEPGFYLIANVFGTKRYFESFMKTLQDRGLEPKSFYRSLNGYNYVYLRRYNTIEEARRARNSKFNGRYNEALWIFRVRGKE